jgi:hypothetical protein
MPTTPPEPSALELARWGVSVVVPAIAGMTGVLVGAWLTSRRDRQQRRIAFREKQLSLFYSPLLGVRNEVQAYGALRVRVQGEADTAWRQLCSETEHLSVEERQRITRERSAEFTRVTEFDDERLHKELLPAYRRMVALFRENYWLAEPSTREFYADVLEFVDIWQRWTEKSLPVEVLERLAPNEEKLNPFYDHLTRMHDELRSILRSGASDA